MTQQIQVNRNAAIWKLNGEGDADYAFSMEGVTDGNGRVSLQIDLGVSPRDFQFEWNSEVLMQATPTQYKTINFYAAGAPDNDSTMIDGDIGAVDAALGGVDQLLSMVSIGKLVIETADTSKMVRSRRFVFTQRYLTIVGFNDTGATINATDSNFIFLLTRFNLQGQAT